jgi:hypothetical protein
MAVQSCRLCTGQNGPAERNASSVFGLEMSLSRIISSAKVPAGYQRTHRLVLDQPWGLGTDGNGAEVACWSVFNPDTMFSGVPCRNVCLKSCLKTVSRCRP